MEDKFFICQICGEKVKKGNGHHIKKCVNDYVSKLSDDKINELKHLYLDEGYSMVDMATFLSFSYSLTTKILKRIGLERRKLSDAVSQKRAKEKYKQTCFKHFGTEHNFSKNCPSRKDWEKRLLETEGITNVFQRKSVKEKIKNTLLERYGEEGMLENYRKGSKIEYYIEKYGKEEGEKYFEYVKKRKSEVNNKEWFINEYGEEKWLEHLKKINERLKYNCGLNDKCEKILKDNNLIYEREFPLISDEYNYSYDFKVDNLLIELNGMYWHCSPKLYKPNDLVKFPNNKFIRACDKWEYDKKKVNNAIEKGYQCVTIWEDEFSEELLLKIINEYKNGKS